MGKQATLSNGPNGISFNAVQLGNPEKVAWIRNAIAFEKLPPSVKYQRFLQKYNILPGQRIFF